MSEEFVSGLELLKEKQGSSSFTTGSPDLDDLLGGGLEPGASYLFYGSRESGIDSLIHQILANTLLSANGQGHVKSVYLNCGNYREEKTILDTQLLSHLLKAAKLNVAEALDRILVFCAFSEEQQEQVVEEVRSAIERDREVKALVVHNIAKLFTSRRGTPNKDRLKRIANLKGVVLRLWQACARNNVTIVASCGASKSGGRIPRPEGGRYLSHEANVLVHLKKVKGYDSSFQAHLLKHPNQYPRKITFTHQVGSQGMGRITVPFRRAFQEELDDLRREYKKALLDPARRRAFESLLRAWASELGAMSNAKIPTVLDVMLLTAAIDNRRVIEEFAGELSLLKADVRRLRDRLSQIHAVTEDE